MLSKIPAGDMVSGTVNLTDTTSTALLAAPGTSSRYAVLGIITTNASDTTASKVKILDGSTAKLQPYAGVKSGWALNGNGYPLFYTTVNTALNAQCATTGTDVDVFVWAQRVPAV